MLDLTYWYWLKGIKGIGPARCNALLEVFGCPETIFQASISDYLEVKTVGKKLAAAIESSKKDLASVKRLLQREIAIAERHQAQMVTIQDPIYPAVLKEQQAVAPPLLYVRGDLAGLTSATLAIVGTREPSSSARAKTEDLASKAASKGWSVISGLALGIDAAAHIGTLRAGGYTVAVLGCGVDRVYPPENKEIFERILEKGAIVSEYRFRSQPRPDNLRKRNKIIVGLARGVFIAECPTTSGALIAAKEAEKQGKPLFTFRPLDPSAESTQGSAKLVTEGKAHEIDDIDMELLGQHIETYVSPDRTQIRKGRSAKGEDR